MGPVFEDVTATAVNRRITWTWVWMVRACLLSRTSVRNWASAASSMTNSSRVTSQAVAPIAARSSAWITGPRQVPVSPAERSPMSTV